MPSFLFPAFITLAPLDMEVISDPSLYAARLKVEMPASCTPLALSTISLIYNSHLAYVPKVDDTHSLLALMLVVPQRAS